MKIITDGKDITPTLIEEILHKTKSLEQVEIKKIKKRISSSFTSNLCFIEVNYSNESQSLSPKRFILKMSKNDDSPFIGKKEVLFYNSVANQMENLPVIPCYDAKFDENTRRSHILLADISKTHFQEIYPVPPTEINCERFIEGLGKLHAFWWDDERLEEIMEKINQPKKYDYEKQIKFHEWLVREFLNFIGDRISEPRKKILNNSIQFAVKYPWKCLNEGKKLTLCHGDAHAFNAFYPKDDIEGKLYFSDWQNISVGRGIKDLVFFMAVHWYPERRKRLELKLLRKYHEILTKSGVNNYSWEDCFHDYRSYIVVQIHFCALYQWFTKKISSIYWWSNLENTLKAFEDLNCFELLESK